MSAVKKTKAKIKMIELGIVPAFTAYELKRMMASLSEEDRIAAKRKFRKQWRKIAKNEASSLVKPSNGRNPGPAQIRNRSVAIVSKIINELE